MCRTVCGQMKLAPYSAPVSLMLPDFLFPLAEDFQTGSVNDEVRDFAMGWRFCVDVNGLCSPGWPESNPGSATTAPSA